MGPEGIRYKMMPGACPGALEGKQSSQAHSRSADKPPHNAAAWLPRPPLTFTRSISSGMFTMACVSQLSRLLAKFRIAWVKAPVEDAGAGQGGREPSGEEQRQRHSLGMGRSTSGMRISTRPWYSTLSQRLVHCSTGWNLERSTRLALGSRFSASSCLGGTHSTFSQGHV